MPFDYIRTEAKVGLMGTRLMAIVAEGERGRVYLVADRRDRGHCAHGTAVRVCQKPICLNKALGFRIQEYGMTKWCHLFTSRQLVALTTFSDLVQETRKRVKRDAVAGRPT